MQLLRLLRHASLCVAIVLLSLCAVANCVAAHICVLPPEGLVSWWPGDGDATDFVSGNDGTLQGGTGVSF